MHDLVATLPFRARNPLYAVLHESSYADGVATRWSAARTLPDDFAGESLLLTGEHLFPWHFEDTPGLRPYRAVAELLAEEEWPRLFDPAVLAVVEVPCAAVVYVDDPFVEVGLSLETAALVPTLRPWITNEFLHSGLRAGGGDLLDRLLGMTRRTWPRRTTRTASATTPGAAPLIGDIYPSTLPGGRPLGDQGHRFPRVARCHGVGLTR